MTVLSLSLNHHHAPVDFRGRFAFPREQLAGALGGLRERLQRAATEAALLSTCNRTELYLAGPAPADELAEKALLWLGQQGATGGVGGEADGPWLQERLRRHTQHNAGEDAARHVFRVAAGLDSMVLGEPQILGQLKSAAREAGNAGTLGSTLHQLFQRSFAVAKEVRTRTELGTHSISMAAAAVKLAGELFEDLRTLQVLLVGAGEMNELVATHFSARQPAGLSFAVRQPDRIAPLLARLGPSAQAFALGDLPQRLAAFDVVISCTSSPLPLIGLGAVERALKLRRRRPMLLVDLAVPRDIEPEVGQLPDAYLVTVDDLAERVRQASDRRHQAVAQAEAIVDAGVRGFAQWCSQRGSVPLIRALQDQAEAWQQAELQRASRLLARGEDVHAVLQSLAQGLSHKMMHGTLHALHQAGTDDRRPLAEAAAQMWLRRPVQCLLAEARAQARQDAPSADGHPGDRAAAGLRLAH